MNSLTNTLKLAPALVAVGGLLAKNYVTSTAESFAKYSLLSPFEKPINSIHTTVVNTAIKTAQNYFSLPHVPDQQIFILGAAGNLAVRAALGAMMGVPLSEQPIVQEVGFIAASLVGSSILASGAANMLHGLTLMPEFITP